MRKKIIIITIIVLLITLLFILLPHIKIDTGSKIMYLNYDGLINDYEENMCYHENVSYVEDKDISINKINIEKKFIFYLITLEYVNGNLCDTEYVLQEEYIKNYINNAEIIYNSHNIDIESLIEGKSAIVSNTRYVGNDYQTFIDFKLNNKYEIMYIFYVDDLLIIQVGSPDEDTKFIAYK